MDQTYPPSAAREDLAFWRASALANPFTSDEQFQRALRRLLGSRLESWEAHLSQVGHKVVALFPLSRLLLGW